MVAGDSRGSNGCDLWLLYGVDRVQYWGEAYYQLVTKPELLDMPLAWNKGERGQDISEVIYTGKICL